MKGFRNRVLGPLVIPLAVLAVIVVLIFNFSRILLALEERHSPSWATLIAVVIGTVMMLGAAFFAFRLEGRATGMSILSAAVAIVLFAGGFGWGLSRGEHGGEEVAGGEGEVAAAPAAGGTVEVTATDPFKFDPKELTVPAGPVTINMSNTGAIVHTFMLEGVDGFTKLIASGTRRKSPDNAETTATEAVTLEPGKYVFFCDERGHRGAGMEGTLTVTEGGAARAAAGGGGASTAKVIATDPFKFDPKDVSVAAGKVTIDLENTGAIVHTLMLEGVDGFEKLITSGLRRKSPENAETTASEEIDLQPGKYVFFCDERGHRGAGMEGTLTVTEGGGAAAAPAAAAGGGAGGVEVTATDPFKFDPKEVTASAGEVTINLKNTGAIVHTLLIDGVDGFKKMIVSGTKRKSPDNAEVTASEVAELKPGKYTFFCDERGHRGAGMEGTLTVS
jgi:plastocyanin